MGNVEKLHSDRSQVNFINCSDPTTECQYLRKTLAMINF